LKTENIEIKESLHKSRSSRWFRDGIHSLLSLADAWRSAGIIYRMWPLWRISLLCG